MDEIIISKEDVIDYINNVNLPIRYLPNEMYHFAIESSWDIWENEQHELQYESSEKYYGKQKYCYEFEYNYVEELLLNFIV